MRETLTGDALSVGCEQHRAVVASKPASTFISHGAQGRCRFSALREAPLEQSLGFRRSVCDCDDAVSRPTSPAAAVAPLALPLERQGLHTAAIETRARTVTIQYAELATLGST